MRVYQKLLEFYQTVYNVVTKEGVHLILRMLLETDRLPKLIQQFNEQTASLGRLIEKATAEITEEIRNMVYDQQGMRCNQPCFPEN